MTHTLTFSVAVIEVTFNHSKAFIQAYNVQTGSK